MNFAKIIIFNMLAAGLQVQAQDYSVQVRELSGPDPQSWVIEMTNRDNPDFIQLKAVFKKQNEVLITESAQIKKSDAGLILYEIENFQLQDRGQIKTEGSNTLLLYTDAEGKKHQKTLGRGELILSPANIDRYIQIHFEDLKKHGTLPVLFFAWEAKDVVKFKINYVGLQDVSGEKQHLFELRPRNFILAAFIDKIQLWFSEDMKTVKTYKGRVAVKKVDPKSGQLQSVDALAEYIQLNPNKTK